jgi:hypothetical protein
MRRRDISKALFATAAESTVVGQQARAQTCTTLCYARTVAETTASVMPVNYTYAPLNPFRYGADGSGGRNDAAALTAIQSVLAHITGVKEWQNGMARAGFEQTAAEIAASVTPKNFAYAPLPVDVRRYGADPTGRIASDEAITKALAICAEAGLNGGTIWLPAGTYLFNKPWVATNGITFLGDGASTGGGQPGTLVRYAGTGSAGFIQLTSTGGCRVQGLQIQNTSRSFTGAMIGALAPPALSCKMSPLMPQSPVTT